MIYKPQDYEMFLSRQAIINGNFDVWQRGVSFTPTDGVLTYGADRWLDYHADDGGTLPTLTRTRGTHTAGDLYNSFYYTRLTADGAGTSLGVNSEGELSQRIEHGVRILCGDGKKVTLSFYARASVANKRIGVGLWQNYGSGGTPTTAEGITGDVFTLTSSWVKYTHTFTTNTLSGKTFGTANDDFLQVSIACAWGTTWGNDRIKASVTAENYGGSGTIDIAQVQLCAGDVALPFMPKSFEEELRACQRYYEKSYDYASAPAATSVLGIVHKYSLNTYDFYDGNIKFCVPKRTSTYTVTYYSYSTGAADKIRNFTDSSDLTFTNAANANYKTNGGFQASANNTLTASKVYYIHWTASDEL